MYTYGWTPRENNQSMGCYKSVIFFGFVFHQGTNI